MIVITGSRGYIGTATRELLEKDGYEILEIDKKIGRDTRYIYSYLTEKPICIIHLSAKKSIPESIKKPFAYYLNNLLSTIAVGIVSRVFNIPVVFSSSAAVYKPQSPYAKGKIWEERCLRLLCPKLAVLRYFNVVGKTETIKDDDSTNVFAVIGRESKININNPTSTRDYVHVMDIARSNIKAMEYLQTNNRIFTDIFTGKQRTMFHVVQEYDKLGHKIEYKVLDIPDVSISPVLDNRSELGWKPKYTFSQAVRSEIRRK